MICSTNLITFVLIFKALIFNLNLVDGELYTSTEELLRWTSARKEILDTFKGRIRLHERRLNKLLMLNDILIEALNYEDHSENEIFNTLSSVSKMEHPVWIFITMRRLTQAIEKIHLLFEDNNEDSLANEFSYDVLGEFNRLKEEYALPSHDDLVGSGEALLRLQSFYELSIEDIIYGKLSNESYYSKTNRSMAKPLMNSNDCFEIGKIAYDNEDYLVSIEWFKKAIELRNSIEQESVVDVLEYMAFAAYNTGQLDYAAQLTQLWLDNDPENERAIGNLEYYLEELDFKKKNVSTNDEVEEQKRTAIPIEDFYKYSYETKFSAANYIVEKDEVVKNLCRKTREVSLSKSCSKISPNDVRPLLHDVRIETLHSNPDIIRIHDIISDYEARQLRKLASSRLERSTVQTKTGLVTTNFRIAKTAWLSKQVDPIIERIEYRISTILNLDLSNAEELQVVNYGIGGFYGPHLDSAREKAADFEVPSNGSSLVTNDRLATILIYLNHVEAGGATVFPKLKLTVHPMKYTAVVWHNILMDGSSDNRTLHTGCPVLLGSKWIATKWPRERPNIFLRVCESSRESFRLNNN